MKTDNVYWYFNDVFNSDECDNIIELGSKNLINAYTAGGRDAGASNLTIPQNLKSNYQLKKEGTIENSYIRDSKVCWLEQPWIYDKIWKALKSANLLAGWQFDIDWTETLQFTKYEAPGGFYGYHQDASGDVNSTYKRYIHGVTPVPLKDDGTLPSGYTGKKQSNFFGKTRKISLSINLSDEQDYEGGELSFDIGEHNSNGEKILTNENFKKRGTCVFFPSSIYHAVSPVTKGTRYSLVAWFLGRPFK